jgi:hypothetical protein
MYGQEEVGVDDENERLMDEGNNVSVKHHHIDMRIWGRQHMGEFFVLVQAIPIEVYRMFLCSVASSQVIMGSGIQG